MENIDTSTPIGSYRKAWLGHSRDQEITKNAASGGIVSAVLCHLLETRKVDAALVCRTVFRDGKLSYDVFLAKNREEVLSAQTSKYFDIPMQKGVKLIKDFDGKVAVVGVPSQINIFHQKCLSSAEFAEKVAFKISVFCGHNSKDQLIREVWRKKGIPEENITKFYFRKGLWRGRMVVELKDGQEVTFPFQEFSHYQNLHILSLDRCLNCFDHMGYYADLSTGDVWIQSQRSEEIKHSIFLARTPRAEEVIEEMATKGLLKADPTDRATVYRSQMRSINYHYNVSARARVAKWFGIYVKDRVNTEVKFRDILGAILVMVNHKISRNPTLLKIFMKLPKPIITLYVYIFKGLMHYKRKVY